MKLWLDDERPAPPEWVHVKSLEEVKAAFAGGAVITHMSLDHDLGLVGDYEDLFGNPHHGEITGRHVVQWMVRSDRYPTTWVNVHSANPAGAEKMVDLLNRYSPLRASRLPADTVHRLSASGKL